MGRFDFRPARVYDTATQLLATKRITAKPPWYETIANNTPPQILVRTQPVQHTGHKHATKKRSKLFRPQTIHYPEDDLRKEFFSDHPWELARPRVILEDSGTEYQEKTWESVRPEGNELSGENVIQRQVWLMERTKLGRQEAYDQARREFYAERMHEDIERRVAKEEAHSTGAYFAETTIKYGMDLEDQVYEEFREWAQKTILEADQARAALSTGTGPEAPPASLLSSETEAETIDAKLTSENAEPGQENAEPALSGSA